MSSKSTTWWGLLATLIVAAPMMAATPDEQFRDAEKYYREMTWDRAAAGFESFAKAAPDDARVTEAGYKQLHALSRLGRTEDLAERLDTFAEANRRSPWGLRARILEATWLRERDRWSNWEKIANLYETALSDYRSLIGRRPTSSEELHEINEWHFAAATFYAEWWDERAKPLALDHLETIIASKADVEDVARARVAQADLYRGRYGDRKKAEAALLVVVNQFAETKVADRAWYLLAQIAQEQENYPLARTRYLELRRRFPKSELEADAKQQIAEIEAPRLELMLSRTHLPGAKIPFHFQTRNLQGVTFTAYSVDLFAAKDLTVQYLNERDKLRQTGQKVATWRQAVADQGKYEFHIAAQQVPIKAPGLYVVEAQADGKPDLKQSALLNISNLVLVQSYAARKLVSYVADRTTRQPVPEVELRVLQPRRGGNEMRLRDAVSGKTNPDGLLETEVAPRGDNGDWRLWTFGRLRDQYVFQDDGLYAWWNEPGTELKAYVYTDRPVYRPENKVQFKAILRNEKEGLFTNLAGKSVEVTVHDPRGKELLKKTLTTDEYGSLTGDLTLDKEPTLGVYGIGVKLGNQGGGGQFRVEEYRKPEFKVTVGKPLAEVRPGGGAAVEVDAQYYFGAPVTDGEVKYVVKRRPYYQTYWWRDPFDWFYAGWDRPRFWRGGEQVVTEGTAKTDGKGKATIEFVTLKDGNDYSYTIEAEVADVSRRVVEASGSVTVTQKAFYLYANTGQHLYRPTDKVTLTAKAQDADSQPVATPVTVELWSTKWLPELKDPKTGRVTRYAHSERDKLMWTRKLDTDPDSGEKKLVFDAPKDGNWEIGLRAPDKFDKKVDVTASTSFWVANDAYKGNNWDHANLQLLPEKDLYQKGQTARLLLNSPVKDGAVLLTIGAVHIYETKVIRYQGNALVLELPVRDNYSPNVYVNATVVGSKQVYFANAELKVPPTDRFVNVKVQSDKAEYKPRTSGQFAVTTTDQDGKPVAAQVSLGITDDSVYAIQEEMAQPIGAYFHGGRRFNGIRSACSFEPAGEYDDKFEPRTEGVALGMPGGFGGGMGGMGGGRPMMQRAGAPPPSPAAMASAPADAAKAAPGAEAGPEAAVAVRSFFPDTIVWLPTVTTNAKGQADVKVDFPDSLTTWRTTARAVTKDTRAGQQVERVVTSKDLICRLQAPRFFTQLDETTVSIIATNKTSGQQQVAVSLQVAGLSLEGEATGSLVVPPNGQARLDRIVRAVNPGRATITATLRGATDSDAVKTDFEVLPHGADKFAAAAGQVTDGKLSFALNLPAERRDNATKLKVSIQPSVINSLVDALPYLVRYPYGCVEQTTSKFLPCVMVARTLDLVGRPATGGATVAAKPAAVKPPQMPEWWDSKGLDELPAMVKTGVDRLCGMQNADGGFGWFGGMRSDLWMSAYVTYGLSQALRADYTVPQDRYTRAIDFLYGNLHLLKSQNDSSAYVAWVLTEVEGIGHTPSADQKKALTETVERVWAERDGLNDYTRALLVLTLAGRRDNERAQVVWRNLQSRRIETAQGCHWGENRWGWRWSEDQVETTAFALLASQKVEPNAALAGKTAQWLLLNRTGNQWYSTKDTAAAILALAEYADGHKELTGTYSVNVQVNGKDVKGLEITPQNALSTNAEIEVDPALLRSGANDVSVTTAGGGSPYVAAMLTYYTKEDPITAASNLMSAKRSYSRVVEYTDKDNKRQTRLEPLANGTPIASGDQIEVKIDIDAENDFSYVAFRDPKPAGCEPVDQTSGGTWGGSYLYRELRDKEVTFFADQLSQGKTTISYRLRAESPGLFRALPHNGFAMYRPDVRCLSDEGIVRVTERPKAP
ncbi:MAG: hypothetical protein HZB16_13115 [Armatimonadetes bacterium]|nr:hypothetical protein [Armatimonadota bacterium]